MAKTINKSDRLLQVLVLVATLLTILFNALAAAGYVNDTTPDAVSAKYPTVITPAGYAFSIWSLIYLGMAAFSIYQFLPSKTEIFRPIRAAYLISCVLNCGWILAWHHEWIGACMLLIASLAASLLWICLALRDAASYFDALLSKVPFGIYFGWVTCAAIVNFFIYLRANDMGGQNVALGVSAIILATGFAIIVRWRLTNYLYAVTVAWALTAIAVKQSGTTPIVLAAAFGTVTCLVTAGSVVTTLKDSTSEPR